MEKITNFYKNKIVFVTGATGFKGSWLVSVLLKYGSTVIGYSKNDLKRKNYWNRVIFDEIDSLNIPKNLEINSKFFWFITSTFDRMKYKFHKNSGNHLNFDFLAKMIPNIIDFGFVFKGLARFCGFDDFLPKKC